MPALRRSGKSMAHPHAMALQPLRHLSRQHVLPAPEMGAAANVELQAEGRIQRGDRRIAGATRSEEHTSELQSLMRISYAVFCLKKKKINKYTNINKPELVTIRPYHTNKNYH